MFRLVLYFLIIRGVFIYTFKFASLFNNEDLIFLFSDLITVALFWFVNLRQDSFKDIIGKFRINKNVICYSLIFPFFELILGIIFLFIYLQIKTFSFPNSSEKDTILTFIISILFIPIVEELFFRGFSLTYLKRKYTTIKSIIIVTIMFSIFHGFISGILFLISGSVFFLSYVYIKYNSLYLCILAHMIKNFIAMIIIPLILDYVEKYIPISKFNIINNYLLENCKKFFVLDIILILGVCFISYKIYSYMLKELKN